MSNYSREKRILKQEIDLWITIPLAIIPLLLIALLRPFLLIRVGFLHNDRLGHFGGNTELLILERKETLIKKKDKKIVDLYYLPRKISCNKTLEIMWKRVLIILPRFYLRPLCLIIRSIPFLSNHIAWKTSNEDRDINNLMDKYPASLSFTEEEDNFGKSKLKEFGLPSTAKFICLNVRDSAYLNSIGMNNHEYHNFRDSNIDDYILAAEELANKGYYIFRMGVNVNKKFTTNHPKIFDYANNGMRSDFMDIYLGAKCYFCISTGSGFDSIPYIFRRPLVFVNLVPISAISSFIKNSICLSKNYYSVSDKKYLTLTEIFYNNEIGLYYKSEDFEKNKIILINNSPQEIKETAIEMEKRLKNEWISMPEDIELQDKFWNLFPVNAVNVSGIKLHGNINSIYSTNYLRNNKKWLQ